MNNTSNTNDRRTMMTRGQSVHAFFARNLKSEVSKRPSTAVRSESTGSAASSKSSSSTSFASRSCSARNAFPSWLSSLKDEEKHDDDCSNYMTKHRESMVKGPMAPDDLLWGSGSSDMKHSSQSSFSTLDETRR
eukprot:CAMPEP_0118685560 /NCGR_PEP_ID=MMETSP0800-20121206/7317_1 /TAXON_ID=210618 ORGANISM="Striatella unipunctata, Strain CCMP2910" /NCGR_SAMPLE_ID=MMETSP0800 /ASSEMBLY_ACC=CAM_ASM_000638 /LENGTH=133 /DNA_ID=CAMNT_0006582491 /DNA_START=76 /DNA_END=477 /DNA_ORIENTATION=-